MSGNRMPIEYVLSDNLKRIRGKKKLSEEIVSRYAGLTLHGYKEIEDELHLPNLIVLVRIARALKCKIDDLLPLDEIE